MGTAQRSPRTHCLVLLLALTSVAGLSLPMRATAASATGTNRAGVVVDLGNGTVRQVGITFSGTVTGLDALQRAGFAPHIRSFGGIGGAVCALDIGGTTLGCPTDASCLTCADPNYWVYFRAPAGTQAFAMSRAGAGSTTVGDGDVEGWRWGTGRAPQFVALDSIFPATTTSTVATTTSSTTITTRPTSATAAGSGNTSNHHSPTPSTRPGTDGVSASPSGATSATTSTTVPGATRSTVPTSSSAAAGPTAAADSSGLPPPGNRPGPDGTAGPSGAVAAGPPRVESDSGTSVVPLVVAVLMIVALGAAIVVTRIRRNASFA